MPRIDKFYYRKTRVSCQKDASRPAMEGITLRVTHKTCRTMFGRFLPLVIAALALGTIPASAVEQCRFIQARAEREACYQRQEAELAAKRKAAEPRHDTTMQALEQMKHEDEALNRQIHSICRGC